MPPNFPTCYELSVSASKTKDTPLGGVIILCTLIHEQKVTDRSFDPPDINFSNDHISGAKELCSLKILLLLESDDSLLTLPSGSHFSRE